MNQARPGRDPASAQLTVSGLHFNYARREVLSGLDFALSGGRITAFLGRNGAGKTTTMHLLAGVLRPGAGTVHDARGKAPWLCPEVRARIGYLPESPPLYPQLTVAEQLHFAAGIQGIDKARIAAAVLRVIESCNLQSVAGRVIEHLSKGFRQRTALAQALVHQPDIVLLDEPGSGLDPVQMDALRGLIRAIANQSCVVFSTHLLNEALVLGDDLLVICDGRQQYFGSAHAIPGIALASCQVRLEARIEAAQLEQIADIERAESSGPHCWRLELTASDAVAAVAAAIVERGWGLCEISNHNSREQSVLAMMAGGQSVAA